MFSNYYIDNIKYILILSCINIHNYNKNQAPTRIQPLSSSEIHAPKCYNCNLDGATQNQIHILKETNKFKIQNKGINKWMGYTDPKYVNWDPDISSSIREDIVWW